MLLNRISGAILCLAKSLVKRKIVDKSLKKLITARAARPRVYGFEGGEPNQLVC